MASCNASSELAQDSLKNPSILSTVLKPTKRISTHYCLVHPVDIDCSRFINGILELSTSDYYLFYKDYFPQGKLLRLQEFFLNRVRLGIFKEFVWTNGLLIKTSILKQCHFLKNDFLEDVILSDYLKRNYQGKIISEYVRCSSRRYISNGIIKQFLLNILIMILYRVFKVSPKKLKSMYYKMK